MRGGSVIRTYDTRKKGTTKVFVVIKDNKSSSVVVGNQAISTDMGFQFYVDDYVAEQIHKCELYLDGLTPRLRVKEGETLFVPEENDEYKRQKEIEELEQKLKELKGDAE